MNIDAGVEYRWLAKLEGDAAALNIWMQQLPLLSDYAVETMPQGGDQAFALTAPCFQELTDADDVRATAEALVGQLNGLMWLAEETKPLRFGGAVYRLGSDGSVDIYNFVGVGTLTLRGFRPQILIGGVAVNPLSEFDQLLIRAISDVEQSDVIADLLTFVGRADNWFDLYKAIEMAEHIAESEHRLQKLMGDRAKAFKNARTTANYYRHSPRSKKNHRPDKPDTFAEAKDLLVEAVKVALKHHYPDT